MDGNYLGLLGALGLYSLFGCNGAGRCTMCRVSHTTKKHPQATRCSARSPHFPNTPNLLWHVCHDGMILHAYIWEALIGEFLKLIPIQGVSGPQVKSPSVRRIVVVGLGLRVLEFRAYIPPVTRTFRNATPALAPHTYSLGIHVCK